MFEELELVTSRGGDLTIADLMTINRARREKLKSSYDIKPKEGEETWTQLWFLLKEKRGIVAFGRLYDVKVPFADKKYPVLGIASIVALVEGQGFGTTLMQGVKNHIRQSGLIGLGFCSKSVSPFYRKCGFEIMEDGKAKFQYSESQKGLIGDAFYIPRENTLIAAMSASLNVASLSRPHW